jgi:hypothetical protein
MDEALHTLEVVESALASSARGGEVVTLGPRGA